MLDSMPSCASIHEPSAVGGAGGWPATPSVPSPGISSEELFAMLQMDLTEASPYADDAPGPLPAPTRETLQVHDDELMLHAGEGEEPPALHTFSSEEPYPVEYGPMYG